PLRSREKTPARLRGTGLGYILVQPRWDYRRTGSEARSSVDCDVRVADDAAPFVALALRVLGECFRRASHCLRSLIGEPLAHFGRGEDRVDLAIEPRDHIARRTCRHRDAAPGKR